MSGTAKQYHIYEHQYAVICHYYLYVGLAHMYVKKKVLCITTSPGRWTYIRVISKSSAAKDFNKGKSETTAANDFIRVLPPHNQKFHASNTFKRNYKENLHLKHSYFLKYLSYDSLNMRKRISSIFTHFLYFLIDWVENL